MQVNAGGRFLGVPSSWSVPDGSGNEFNRARFGVLAGVFDRRAGSCVGNGQRGYHFFGQTGTRPKSVRFGEVVPVRVGNGIFS
jgi:hypothetical protein